LLAEAVRLKQGVIAQQESVILQRLLRSGSRPRRPADIPFDKQTVLDSTSILNLRHLPESLLVVGGGVIACEFVSIFAALGVQVSVVDSHKQLLAYLSEYVVQVLADSFLVMWVSFHMQERVAQITRDEAGTLTTLPAANSCVPMRCCSRKAANLTARG
jgi:NAD(P) transhydrogenase